MTCKSCANANNCPHILKQRVMLALLAGQPCPYWRVRVQVVRLGIGLVDRPGEVKDAAL